MNKHVLACTALLLVMKTGNNRNVEQQGLQHTDTTGYWVAVDVFQRMFDILSTNQHGIGKSSQYNARPKRIQTLTSRCKSIQRLVHTALHLKQIKTTLFQALVARQREIR